MRPKTALVMLVNDDEIKPVGLTRMTSNAEREFFFVATRQPDLS